MCCNKEKRKCTGQKIYSPCVMYQEDVPQYSSLVEDSCISIEDTTKDLYQILGEVKESLDLSILSEACLTLPSLVPKDVVIKLVQEICDLKEKVLELENTNLCNTKITDCGIDLSDLEDACGNTITTFSQLINAIITKLP